MSLDLNAVAERLADFDFSGLFIEELGWSRPTGVTPKQVNVGELTFTAKPIAQLAAVVILEVASSVGTLPDAKTRDAVHREIVKIHYENVLIFVDQERTRSEWLWVKRENGKDLKRPHTFLRGQPGDLFITKVAPLLFEVADFETGEPSVVEVARRLRLGLDIERVTKKFYGQFYEQHLAFLELITGIDDEHDRRWYASILLNRLMFVWFLQKKGNIDRGNLNYLTDKLAESQSRGKNRFYREFLTLLFFEGFAKPANDRSEAARNLLGEVRYLNGGLFLRHAIEQEYKSIDVPDRAFENLFKLFQSYSWNLNDTPGGDANEINPDVLGYIFEKYINQKAFGAYYTRTEITTYLCERTIHRLILDAVNTPKIEFIRSLPGKNYDFKTVSDLLANLDAPLTKKLLYDVLPKLSILDPACGSGAFLVAAMKTLINIYTAAFGYARYRDHGELRRKVEEVERDHPNVEYFVKKSIITNNLYGVDIMEEAVEIAKLRLFLALVASARTPEQLEPLPNIDFNLLAGNSLIGLLRVDEQEFDEAQKALFRQRGREILTVKKSYRHVVDEKNRSVATYRYTATYSQDLRVLRDAIDELREEAAETLNDILLDAFQSAGVQYEEATWDSTKQREGKGKKRPLTREDIAELAPFHWGYEFDEIINKRGGFDAIITNPPWESVEPKAKEFFEIAKNATDIKDFEKELARQLRDKDVMEEWLAYLSRFNHERAWFRSAPEYENQIPIINGKRQGKDINLYKLFVERCHRLLREGGECGLVVPGGIYSDLGAKRLRELLFESTEITGLFGFENRRQIFEGVDSRFKFVVLTFRKGGETTEFPAAFMRHDVRELEAFPHDRSVDVTVDLVRRLSPDSLSISEFQNATDLEIAEKMIKFPLLGERIDGMWQVELHREFNMTDDAAMFHKVQGSGMLPLYEGKMIWQFDAFLSEPRYFIRETDAKRALRAPPEATDQFDYEKHRLAIRDVARNTDERTMIAAVLPARVFAGHTLHLCATLQADELLYVASVLNSFVFDWLLRQKVGAHCSIFYIYQMPVPRLVRSDRVFQQLVTRSAALTCYRAEFADLAAAIGGDHNVSGASDRPVLRAEIDAIVAHLYGITESEFRHMLAAFPLVPKETKEQALATFLSWKPAQDDALSRLIAAGESLRLEFKSSARWDYQRKSVNKDLETVIVKTLAALMNSEGGTLLIGVSDDGTVLGLEPDFGTIGKKNADAYENWLMTRVLDSIGRDRARLLRVSFHAVEDKQVCRVDAERSAVPVFVKDSQAGDRLFVRAGNSTRELLGSELLKYCQEHFTPERAAAAAEAQAPAKSGKPVQQRLDASAHERKVVAFPEHGLFQKKEKQVDRVADAATEESDDDTEGEPRRRLVDQYSVEDVLLHVRDVVAASAPIDREDLIREIASRLGADRVGSRIRELIESALNTASRRYIIEKGSDGWVLATRSIDDYDRNFLKTALKNATGRTWTKEEEAIRSATRWLGFRRTGPNIEKALRSAINGAIRQNVLERNGAMLRVKTEG